MTEHQELREQLGAYVLGQLDLATRTALETHLADCASCRAEVAEALPPVADATEAVVDRALVVAALDQLSEDHRQVIVETYLRGRSYEELAAETGVAAGTLRSRSYYALRALRVTMEEMGVSL